MSGEALKRPNLGDQRQLRRESMRASRVGGGARARGRAWGLGSRGQATKQSGMER